MGDDRAIDLGNHPVIYADDIEEALHIGPNVRVKLYEWRLMDGAMTKVIVLEVIRPFNSLRFLHAVLRTPEFPAQTEGCPLH